MNCVQPQTFKDPFITLRVAMEAGVAFKVQNWKARRVLNQAGYYYHVLEVVLLQISIQQNHF